MEISQFEVKSEVIEVQGVSLDGDKRELQRLARDSADYYFRDKQVEASDALIDEIGALLRSTDHRDCCTRPFRSQGWRLAIETRFCN